MELVLQWVRYQGPQCFASKALIGSSMRRKSGNSGMCACEIRGRISRIKLS